MNYSGKLINTRNLANHDNSNIWQEDIEKTPLLSKRQFNRYIENNIDDDIYENGIALPTILTDYENNIFKMVKLLEKEYNIKHSKGGRKSKLTMENKLRATIEYLTTQKTFAEIAKEYNIHESNMYDSILWVIKILTKYKIMDCEKDSANNNRLIAVINCKNLYFLDIKKI